MLANDVCMNGRLLSTTDSYLGASTRFGGYSSLWPAGGFTASIDIYLDKNMSAGSGFDYSVSASNNTGGFLRDFIFHVAQDTSTGDLLIATSNNSNFYPAPQNLEDSVHYAVATSGWYTFQQKFYAIGDHLGVDYNIYDFIGKLIIQPNLR